MGSTIAWEGWSAQWMRNASMARPMRRFQGFMWQVKLREAFMETTVWVGTHSWTVWCSAAWQVEQRAGSPSARGTNFRCTRNREREETRNSVSEPVSSMGEVQAILITGRSDFS